MKIKGKIVFAFLCLIILLSMFSVSCSREATFEAFVISSEIDDDYNAPIYPREEYVEGNIKGNIYAVIKVIGANRDNTFKFAWINNDTDEILFEDTNKYSSQEKGFLQGYFYSFIDSENTSLTPGQYRVEFYNNNELKSTVYFKVRS
ncbi:MAG: hypothetical protein MUP02_09010 [Actinobacteria bacterium]|nr:hypothetical protein [Actinomycetota bacterium]